MYFILGISLLFAFLLVLNVPVSIFASMLWRAVADLTQNWTGQNRARFIFALRVFPFAAASLFVFAFLLPAYLLFEPHSSDETVTYKLAALSAASLVGVGVAFYRVFGTWRATRNLVADWTRNGEEISVAGVSVPVYRIRHSFPVIAVVGAFRPRMFVAEQIFESLDTGEFEAAVRHEAGHIHARDNFKRAAMRVCRDLLVFPFGAKLDRAWAENIESGADEYAAQTGGSQTALNLASALIKIARIIPPGAKPSMPAVGAFLIEQPTAEIAARVRRLVQMSGAAPIAQTHGDASNFTFRLLLALSFYALIVFATNQVFLEKVHDLLETIVAVLQ